MTNMKIWNQVASPPPTALKRITGGRLNGMTDISPQWRIKALTETFGPVGVGWFYEIARTWTEQGSDGQVCAFAEVHLYIKQEEWSRAIPGIGGSMLVTKESKGLHTSDECYKMAVTDAISVAAKALGVAASIYEGLWDGSKYKTGAPAPKTVESVLATVTDKDRVWELFKRLNIHTPQECKVEIQTITGKASKDLDAGDYEDLIIRLTERLADLDPINQFDKHTKG